MKTEKEIKDKIAKRRVVIELVDHMTKDDPEDKRFLSMANHMKLRYRVEIKALEWVLDIKKDELVN
jgi:hypothetical protein